MNNKLDYDKEEPFKIIKSDFSDEDLNIFYQHYLSLEWEEDVYFFSGKKVIPKRKTFMMGYNYTYSGQEKIAKEFDEITLLIKNKIENFLDLPSNYFNGCLLNIYPDGDASISPHFDNEKEMDKNAIIISFSLGATRKFNFEHINKNNDNRFRKFKINNGDILIMFPEAQEYWRHSIPKEKDVKECRISLTFRKFISDFKEEVDDSMDI